MTPDELEHLVRAAAQHVTGRVEVPEADVRLASTGTGADYVSPIATRLAGQMGTAPPILADRIARALVEHSAISAATATPVGFVEVTVTPAARFAVLVAASTGWGYLATLAPRPHASNPPDPTARRWPRTALEHAATVDEAAAWARADATNRIESYCVLGASDTKLATTGATTPDEVTTSPRPAPTVRGDWRDPYLYEPPGHGEAAELLSVVGEPAVRVAGCAAAHPLPTATRPSGWECQIARNPAFALRHAHAHAHTSVFRWGAELGATPGASPERLDVLRLLECPAAAHIVAVLFEGPGVVRSAQHRGRPSILVRYLEELAAAYREWTRTASAAPAPAHPPTSGGVLPGDPRLDLSLAVARVLGTGLFLLGVSAPTEL